MADFKKKEHNLNVKPNHKIIASQLNRSKSKENSFNKAKLIDEHFDIKLNEVLLDVNETYKKNSLSNKRDNDMLADEYLIDLLFDRMIVAKRLIHQFFNNQSVQSKKIEDGIVIIVTHSSNDFLTKHDVESQINKTKELISTLRKNNKGETTTKLIGFQMVDLGLDLDTYKKALNTQVTDLVNNKIDPHSVKSI